VICAGGIPAHTAAMLGQAIGSNVPSGLLSFGIAGGLAPRLAPGTLVLADAVIASDGTRHPVDAHGAPCRGDLSTPWRAMSSAAMRSPPPRPRRRRFMRAAAPSPSISKARSSAGAASRAGLPFLVIRAIADPAEHDLPPAASARLKPDGRPDLRAVFHFVLMEPGQIAALIGLAFDTRRRCAPQPAPGGGGLAARRAAELRLWVSSWPRKAPPSAPPTVAAVFARALAELIAGVSAGAGADGFGTGAEGDRGQRYEGEADAFSARWCSWRKWVVFWHP